MGSKDDKYQEFKVSPGAQKFIEDLKSLLQAAKCPNCDGSGSIPVEISRIGTKWQDDGYGNPIAVPTPEVDWDVEPCQWCYEREQILKE